MNVVARLNDEADELKFAFRYYKTAGNRNEAWRCYWELQGLRRARAIIVRCADGLERAA